MPFPNRRLICNLRATRLEASLNFFESHRHSFLGSPNRFLGSFAKHIDNNVTYTGRNRSSDLRHHLLEAKRGHLSLRAVFCQFRQISAELFKLFGWQISANLDQLDCACNLAFSPREGTAAVVAERGRLVVFAKS